jgi:hypothetical protein
MFESGICVAVNVNDPADIILINWSELDDAIDEFVIEYEINPELKEVDCVNISCCEIIKGSSVISLLI